MHKEKNDKYNMGILDYLRLLLTQAFSLTLGLNIFAVLNLYFIA